MRRANFGGLVAAMLRLCCSQMKTSPPDVCRLQRIVLGNLSLYLRGSLAIRVGHDMRLPMSGSSLC